jgi:hypothetical protein
MNRMKVPVSKLIFTSFAIYFRTTTYQNEGAFVLETRFTSHKKLNEDRGLKSSTLSTMVKTQSRARAGKECPLCAQVLCDSWGSQYGTITEVDSVSRLYLLVG